jgi:hypothetical protein
MRNPAHKLAESRQKISDVYKIYVEEEKEEGEFLGNVH